MEKFNSYIRCLSSLVDGPGEQPTQAKQEQANHFATEQTSSVESFLSMGPARPRAENVEDPVPARGSQIDQAKLRLSLAGLARTRLPPAPCRGRVSARGAALDTPGTEHRVRVLGDACRPTEAYARRLL